MCKEVDASLPPNQVLMGVELGVGKTLGYPR